MEMHMKKPMEVSAILFVYSFIFAILRTCRGIDIIIPGQSMRGNETLISVNGSFELGFFSFDDPGKWYLGIWYKEISVKTVAWVANRETPIPKSSGILHFSDQGILALQNGTNNIVWSVNSSRTVENPVVKLLDSGNLVIKDANDDNAENFLWQSFDYPSDTLLPGMKLGSNLVTGLDRIMTSWKDINDPGNGEFTCRIDIRGYPQLVIMTGSAMKYRGGPWNGIRFSGIPEQKPNQLYTYKFVLNENEVYYTYGLQNSSVISRLVVNQTGPMQRYVWIDRTQSWNLYLSLQMDYCDNYASCGVYASCNVHNSPVCSCLQGFVPKSPNDWSLLDWSSGCVRKTQLDCKNGDGFLKYEEVKLPDTSHAWFNTSLSLKECEQMCFDNCSCTAYANTDIRGGGSGCILWFGDLIDIREFLDGGQDLYVRMATSELDHILKKKRSTKMKKIALIVSCLVLLMTMVIAGMLLYARKKKFQRLAIRKDSEQSDYENEYAKEDIELQTLGFATIETATEKFSIHNKLGEGGFGSVYKGTLEDGQEIAVKRLDRSSGQGLIEFKNEVLLISKLQHRNLVKLLGCCIQGHERMLIYEYLPNKSLDFFIFDQTKSRLLDWNKRIHIINGIARGLLYLHHDSRLRIIHRDMKASNILLDNDMNPKISDFGVARTFGGDQSEANTTKVVGTYGYMSPEYAGEGLVSVKSDVFSFGVVVLEIVSGKRNRGFYHHGGRLNLPAHAWRLWMEDRQLELLDESLLNCCPLPDMLRCIHVGLLCVQQLPEDRPNMSSVIVMLSSESPLPEPKQPGYYTERNTLQQDSPLSLYSISSANEISTTLLDGR